MKGKVKWYDMKKGYGFITPEDGTKDIFVHHSGIKSDRKPKEMHEGDDVEFELATNDRGRTAVNALVFSTASPQ